MKGKPLQEGAKGHAKALMWDRVVHRKRLMPLAGHTRTDEEGGRLRTALWEASCGFFGLHSVCYVSFISSIDGNIKT